MKNYKLILFVFLILISLFCVDIFTAIMQKNNLSEYLFSKDEVINLLEKKIEDLEENEDDGQRLMDDWCVCSKYDSQGMWWYNSDEKLTSLQICEGR